MRSAGVAQVILQIVLVLAASSRIHAAPPAATGPDFSSVASIPIDRVEISGVTALASAEVEAEVEIAPGERLERAKVVRTAENLQKLYRSRGYERVSIRSELRREKSVDARSKEKLQAVLEFKITEGPATRISALRFQVSGAERLSATQRVQGIESLLRARAGVSVGDSLDQEKIASGRRGLQDLLASEEYIGARIEEARVVDDPAPPAAALALDPGAARWVALEYRVDLGDRVSFGFRGNTVFTASQFESAIADQRLLGFGKDYVGAIRARLEDEYRAAGFGQVRVEAFPVERPGFGERHVTFVIDEGPRMEIESVEFDGHSVFTAEELTDQFFAQGSPLVQRRIYVAKEVNKAAELLVEWMKSKGYLAAKLVTVNASIPAKPAHVTSGKFVKLVIYLYEGDQTLVDRIELRGMSVIPAEEAKRILGVQENAPLNLFAFSEGIEALKTAYRARGYLGARMVNEGTDQVIRYSQKNRAADVMVEVDEGPEYRVGRIELEGLSTTRPEVVERELQFREGEVLTEPAMALSENRLRRLNLFSVVSIRTTDDPSRPGYKIVRVSAQEGTPGVLGGGVGFRNDLGPRVFGFVEYANLLGKNHSLSLSANANRRVENYRFVEYQAQLAYHWPWFAFGETSLRPAVTVAGTQYRSFDAITGAFSATLERRFAEYPRLTGLLTYSLERVVQFNAAFIEDNQALRLGSLTPAIRYDSRDSVLNPTRGFFGLASFEYATPWLLSQGTNYPVSYIRAQARADYLVPVAREVSWYLSFRTGFERNNEEPLDDPDRPGEKISGSGEIPLIKQFALGGAGSLRGFDEQELNFQQRKIRGSLSYVNYRTQVDLPFAGALRFGPFLDAANLLNDNCDAERCPIYSLSENLRVGYGVGFHYQTPVGPVNLDWGFKHKPRPDEDRYRFYFSVGII